jgi:protocatechuate 3,4-dioxygenase alpha subunit
MTEPLEPTAHQTVGPYYAIGMDYAGEAQVVAAEHPGAIVLDGRVFDGAGAVIPDAVVELWGAGPDGSIPAESGSFHRHVGGFTGFGRSGTDFDGWYGFTTLEPAPASPGAAAFFAITVFARGLLASLHTRIYLPDDTDALDLDPLLSRLSPERRGTLIATRLPDGRLRHDIHLQGENETVFLAFR